MAAPPSPDNPLALIVAGPTCSGKSALALAIARRVSGTIINSDAMQTYRELRAITARPTPAEAAVVPHALYGVRAACEPGNAAWWRTAALAAMDAARGAGRLPILCGGTGLYFSALTEGLAEIPDPGPQARAAARARLAEIGAARLHAELAAQDPETASRLRPTDSQRIARAWEVLRGTGRGLAAWQAGPALPPAPWRFKAVHLDPPRAELRAAIEQRFSTMMRDGALEEVRALVGLGLDSALPAMRAHGVPELAAYLRGEIGLEEAELRAVRVTVSYTKRQATWFRHHTLAPNNDTRVILSRVASDEQCLERFMPDLCNFLSKQVDVPQDGL
jgi:tRNA dimethylallyltransferase